jgi:hypothetical protein
MVKRRTKKISHKAKPISAESIARRAGAGKERVSALHESRVPLLVDSC